ncbi:MAG TPA: hypothetical protein EYP14_17350, partial [Planctomycetaceae bacterium]|nr:hypothetical protein [Planctomycetaceae bacterium]
PYRIRGRVGPGAGRGRQLGFPTANLQQIPTLVPRDGVYAAVAYWDGQPFTAAVHHGPNPTFAEDRQKLEVHLADFSGDLTGAELDVDLLARIRDIRTFSSPDELRSQLEKDVCQAREIVRRSRWAGRASAANAPAQNACGLGGVRVGRLADN